MNNLLNNHKHRIVLTFPDLCNVKSVLPLYDEIHRKLLLSQGIAWNNMTVVRIVFQGHIVLHQLPKASALKKIFYAIFQI